MILSYIIKEICLQYFRLAAKFEHIFHSLTRIFCPDAGCQRLAHTSNMLNLKCLYTCIVHFLSNKYSLIRNGSRQHVLYLLIFKSHFQENSWLISEDTFTLFSLRSYLLPMKFPVLRIRFIKHDHFNRKTTNW